MAEPSASQPHADADLLCLLALGESAGDADERAHVDTCAICAEELAVLHRLTDLGRNTGMDALETPSESVWARIRAELDFDPSLEPPLHQSFFLPGDDLLVPDSDLGTQESGRRGDDPAPAEQSSPAVPARAGRSSSRSGVLGGLAAAAGAVTAGVRARLGSTEDLIGQAALTPVDDRWGTFAGRARLSTDRDGHRVMRMEIDTPLPAGGIRQVWLLDREDPTRMQSLGMLDKETGFWSVSENVDLDSYTLVDVSQQPDDGSSTVHSGDTIVRGELVLV